MFNRIVAWFKNWQNKAADRRRGRRMTAAYRDHLTEIVAAQMVQVTEEPPRHTVEGHEFHCRMAHAERCVSCAAILSAARLQYYRTHGIMR